MDNKIECLRMTANQLKLDEQSKAFVNLHTYTIECYNKQIDTLKEDIKEEKRKLASFIIKQLDQLDEIDKYKHLGVIVFCENLLFVYGDDNKFHYALVEEE